MPESNLDKATKAVASYTSLPNVLNPTMTLSLITSIYYWNNCVALIAGKDNLSETYNPALEDNMFKEEYDELNLAIKEFKFLDALDAIGDMIFVAIGTKMKKDNLSYIDFIKLSNVINILDDKTIKLIHQCVVDTMQTFNKLFINNSNQIEMNDLHEFYFDLVCEITNSNWTRFNKGFDIHKSGPKKGKLIKSPTHTLPNFSRIIKKYNLT